MIGRGNGKLVNIIILYRTYRREAWRLERIGDDGCSGEIGTRGEDTDGGRSL